MKSKALPIRFNRIWAMPNKYTFAIPPIYEFIFDHINSDGIERRYKTIVDPFCGSSLIANIRNDMRESGVESLDWLMSMKSASADVVLFDPPYSPRQKKECYDDVGVHLSDTTSGYWAELKDEIARITKPGGLVLSFGWNSNGIGMSRSFRIIEPGLIVAHGGNHNDTMCTAERKIT